MEPHFAIINGILPKCMLLLCKTTSADAILSDVFKEVLKTPFSSNSWLENFVLLLKSCFFKGDVSCVFDFNEFVELAENDLKNGGLFGEGEVCVLVFSFSLALFVDDNLLSFMKCDFGPVFPAAVLELLIDIVSMIWLMVSSNLKYYEKQRKCVFP